MLLHILILCHFTQSFATNFLYTVVSRKYAPPFATLALVQNAGGGAYTRDATISLAITPSLPGMKSLSVWGGGTSAGRRRERGGEMLTTLAV